MLTHSAAFPVALAALLLTAASAHAAEAPCCPDGECAWEAPGLRGEDRPPAPVPPALLSRYLSAYPTARPRTYSGAYLEHVRMPIGGIGTGSIWLDGQGRLAVWQVLNNATENRIPDSFFAVRAQAPGKDPVTRVLQTTPEAGFAPMASLVYEGGYPIARLHFTDPALPVSVRLDAFNPMIPGDAANSSLPCALFRITVHNSGKETVRVHALGTLQNAVGSGGAAGIEGVKFARYGGNRNDLYETSALTGFLMHQGFGQLRPGPVKVRAATGAEVRGPEILWVEDLDGPAQTTAAGLGAAQAVEAMARLTREGGGIVATGVTPAFLQSVSGVQAKMGRWNELEVFEDFEGGSYEGWTVKGTAFGERPHTGTTPNQQPVSGFLGKGLANSFLPNDAPQGEMLSKPFTIRRRYVGFLIGGGAHAGETCLNLLVEGRVARTATGKNLERLEARAWDVSDLRGKEAVLQIVDKRSDAWGHVNVDHIVFADLPPDALMRLDNAVEALATAVGIRFENVSSGSTAGVVQAMIADPLALEGVKEPWGVGGYTRLAGFQAAEGWRVLAALPNGDPLVVMGPAGRATLVLALAPDVPPAWLGRLLLAARGQALGKGEFLAPGTPDYGTLALAAAPPSPSRTGRGRAGTTARNWTDGPRLGEEFAASGSLGGGGSSLDTPEGETVNAALSVPLTLGPGEERTATFVIAWHFPNVSRYGHPGNLYGRRFPNAIRVADYVCRNLAPLWDRTLLYHQTLYQSNLPEEWLDACSSQSVIFRGPTAWWAEDGYYAGYEGCYGCCPLNCTHVWNYAQTHARLFPEVGRNMRESDLLVYLHDDGETSHRQHAPTNAFMDGHAATIEGAYREYQMCPDRAFLERVWPAVQKATDWLIERLDADRDGVPAGRQPNTYDCDVSGANTFIGSQYLSALAAAERMALAMSETETADGWRGVREAGMKNQNERLWHGEYYIQIPDPQPARDYNTGCHSDQLLGQWWAHQLGLGYLYPKERVRRVLEAVMAHNFRETFAGFQQRPRRYVTDDEGGLLMCTWPKGGRPDPFIVYADEVWTGIEYAVAGAMIYEGMIEPARKIVKTARGRYDGRKRDGLNSGPGGNPFNELECGKFYARAMSSWSLLLASQGLVLEGPAGVLGFKPNWQPEDHRSFFTAPEGWGLFVQARRDGRQTERIEVRHGRLVVKELVFALPDGMAAARATVTVGGRAVKSALTRDGAEARLRLEKPAEVREGGVVEVVFQ